MDISKMTREEEQIAFRKLAARAYNAIKDKSDPEFNATSPTYQNELIFATESVIKTGYAASEFEKKVKELDAPKAEGKTEVKAVAPKAEPKAEVKAETKPAPAAKGTKAKPAKK